MSKATSPATGRSSCSSARRASASSSSKQSKRRGDRLPRLAVVLPRILAQLREPLPGRENVPCVGAPQPLELGPLQRHRNAQPGPRPRRERGRGGGAAAVAQVVDEDLADAVLRAAL